MADPQKPIEFDYSMFDKPSATPAAPSTPQAQSTTSSDGFDYSMFDKPKLPAAATQAPTLASQADNFVFSRSQAEAESNKLKKAIAEHAFEVNAWAKKRDAVAEEARVLGDWMATRNEMRAPVTGPQMKDVPPATEDDRMQQSWDDTSAAIRSPEVVQAESAAVDQGMSKQALDAKAKADKIKADAKRLDDMRSQLVAKQGALTSTYENLASQYKDISQKINTNFLRTTNGLLTSDQQRENDARQSSGNALPQGGPQAPQTVPTWDANHTPPDPNAPPARTLPASATGPIFSNRNVPMESSHGDKPGIPAVQTGHAPTAPAVPDYWSGKHGPILPKFAEIASNVMDQTSGALAGMSTEGAKQLAQGLSGLYQKSRGALPPALADIHHDPTFSGEVGQALLSGVDDINNVLEGSMKVGMVPFTVAALAGAASAGGAAAVAGNIALLAGEFGLGTGASKAVEWALSNTSVPEPLKKLASNLAGLAAMTAVRPSLYYAGNRVTSTDASLRELGINPGTKLTPDQVVEAVKTQLEDIKSSGNVKSGTFGVKDEAGNVSQKTGVVGKQEDIDRLSKLASAYLFLKDNPPDSIGTSAARWVKEMGEKFLALNFGNITVLPSDKTAGMPPASGPMPEGGWPGQEPPVAGQPPAGPTGPPNAPEPAAPGSAAAPRALGAGPEPPADVTAPRTPGSAPPPYATGPTPDRFAPLQRPEGGWAGAQATPPVPETPAGATPPTIPAVPEAPTQPPVPKNTEGLSRLDEVTSELSQGGGKLPVDKYRELIKSRGDLVHDLVQQGSLQPNREDYTRVFGNVINADNASELIPGLHEPDRWSGMNMVRPQAGALVQKIFEEAMLDPRTPTAVLFTGGGTGSGKSSGTPQEGEVTLDTTLSNLQASANNIDLALSNGHSPRIIFTYRDPIVSFVAGVIPRAQETGRPVPVIAHARSHVMAPQVLMDLAEKYATDPDVKIAVIDNTGATPVTRDLSWLRQQALRYTDVHELANQLAGIVHSAADRGDVSPQLAKALLGAWHPGTESGAGKPEGTRGVPATPRPEAPGIAGSGASQGPGTEVAPVDHSKLSDEEQADAAIRQFLEEQHAKTTPPEKPPVTPAHAAESEAPAGLTPIGVNSDGQRLFKDKNGIHHLIDENGVRVTEPVRMIPTREGIKTAPREVRPSEFEPTDTTPQASEPPETKASHTSKYHDKLTVGSSVQAPDGRNGYVSKIQPTGDVSVQWHDSRTGKDTTEDLTRAESVNLKEMPEYHVLGAKPTETPKEEKELPRRNAMGSEALERALSPEAQKNLDAMFKRKDAARDLRHVREAMEVYHRLQDAGETDAARAVKEAAEDFFVATKRQAQVDAAGRLDAAAHKGLQIITGEEDPDPSELLENEVYASAHEVGRLVFDTLDPKTASFDTSEFNTAFSEVEWRKPEGTLFPKPADPVNLHADLTPSTKNAKSETLIPQDEANDIVEGWKTRAKEIGKTEDHSKETILSLFDVSGVWSQPWRDAGYNVIQFDIKNGDDLMNFGDWMSKVEEEFGEDRPVVGIMGGPPCTSFSSSGAHSWELQHDAKNSEMVEKKYGLWAAKMFERPIDYANTLVAVMKLIVEQANPKFYAMENPVGRIKTQNGLPDAALTFDPSNFGDPYTKQTMLWGEFNEHLPTANVAPTKGSMIAQLRGDVAEQKSARSETPPGFAYSFFIAQHELLHGTAKPDTLETAIEKYDKTGEITNVEHFADEVERLIEEGKAPAELKEKIATLRDDLENEDVDTGIASEHFTDSVKKAMENAQKLSMTKPTADIGTDRARAGASKPWTEESGKAFIDSITPALKNSSYDAKVVGSVAVKGVSEHDLDVVLTPTSEHYDFDAVMKSIKGDWRETFGQDKNGNEVSAWEVVLPSGHVVDFWFGDDFHGADSGVVKPKTTSEPELPNDAQSLKDRLDSLERKRTGEWMDYEENQKLEAEMQAVGKKLLEVDPARAALIERIVKAGRREPLEIQEVREVKGSNGKWYRAGVTSLPTGVTSTGEYRTKGYSYKAKDGTSVGTIHPTEEIARQAQEDHADRDAQDFRDALMVSPESRLQDQAKHWLPEPVQGPKRSAEIQRAIDDLKASMDAKAQAKPKSGTKMMKTADEAGAVSVPDRDDVIKMVKILRLYIASGMNFRDAAIDFQDAYGAGARALDRLFEIAWKMNTQEDHQVADALRPDVGSGGNQDATSGTKSPRGLEGRGQTPSGDEDSSLDGGGAPRSEDLEGTESPDSGLAPKPPRPAAGGKRGTSPRVRGPRGGGKTPGAGEDVLGGSGTNRAGHADPADATDNPAISDANARGEQPRHYYIDDADDIATGSSKEKLEGNMAALRLLKQLEVDNRPASDAEQRILAKYMGWGHTDLKTVVDFHKSRISDPRLLQAREELESLLTKAEIQELGESTANAHYSFSDLPRMLWTLTQQLGFKGGSVLEPALGTGHFFGTMPPEIVGHKLTRLFGVDKEPIAAAIAKQLYQGAFIQNSPLQNALIPMNYFDVSISNVPFGNYSIFDPAFLSPDKIPAARSIHNYFIAKQIDAARPGGLVIAITSRMTMDSKASGARAYLDRHAKLIGAIRLPQETFKKTAGTDVVTDILVFQKRLTPGEKTAGEHDWLDVKDRDDSLGKTYDNIRRQDVSVYTNDYFMKHPDMILGKESLNGKMQHANSYTVEGQGPRGITPEQIAETLAKFPVGIYEESKVAPRQIALDAPKDTKQGSFSIDKKGNISQFDQGTLVPIKLSKPDTSRVKLYIPLREAYAGVLDAMNGDVDDAQLEKLQAKLREKYKAFTDVHGPVNQPANQSVLGIDPDSPRIFGLENFGQRRVQIGKIGRKEVFVTSLADIFTKRVRRPIVEPTTADSAQSALQQSLGWKGRVDMDYMSMLTGKPVDLLGQELDGRVFKDPATNTWIAKDMYLSGDVVTKLSQAEARAAVEPEFAGHVAALKEVQPVAKKPEEFKAPFGATWIPTDMYSKFMEEESRADVKVRLLNIDGRMEYFVTADQRGTHGFLPQGADFGQWMEDALNNRLPKIMTGPSGARVVDVAATEQYHESMEQLRESWAQWWLNNPKAAPELASIFNAMFNREVDPVWDGSHLVMQGANPEIVPYPWQKDSAWRAIQSGNTLLAHAMGSGKTFTGVMIAGLWKQYGLANKIAVVVPNAVVGSWQKHFMAMYPTAKVLVPTSEDFTAKNRQRFVAKVANNDWDAIIFAHSHFERISVRPETLKAFTDEQEAQLLAEGADQLNVSVDRFNEMVDSMDDKKSFLRGKNAPRSVKEIAKMIQRNRARMQKRLDQSGADKAISFEDLGIDAMEADEVQNYKNAPFATRRNGVAGLNPSDADRAVDMLLKVRILNKTSGNKNIVFMTGTPVTNAMSEIYTMFRYLAQDELDRLGMSSFDAWAGNFTTAESASEATPEGGYKDRVRLRKWNNAGTLSKLFRKFTDVLTTEEMLEKRDANGKPYLSIPSLKNGHVTVIDLEQHPEYPQFQQSLVHRIQDLKSGRPSKERDNHLWINHDAAAAAIDLRLVLPNAKEDVTNGRVPRVAREVAKRYKEHNATKGTQLVFLDIGVPDPKKLDPLPKNVLAGELSAKEIEEASSVAESPADELEVPEEITPFDGEANYGSIYEDLKRYMVKQGIPSDEIAFIHQARDPFQQELLFKAMREGRVRVLIATRSKGGVGINVQDKGVAIHQVDVPYRPDQIDQSNARFLRQGNENKEVEIIHYVTKGTFDEARWDLVRIKSHFIQEFMRGNLDDMATLEDVDPKQMDLNLLTAIASGDPRKLKIMNLERELKGLRSRETNYTRRQNQAKRDAAVYEKQIATNTFTLEKSKDDLRKATEWAALPTIDLLMEKGRYGLERLHTPTTIDWGTPEGRKQFSEQLVTILKDSHLYLPTHLATAGPFEIWASPIESRSTKIVNGQPQTVTEDGVSVWVKGAGRVVGTAREWMMTSDAQPPDYARSLASFLKPESFQKMTDGLERAVAMDTQSLTTTRKILDQPFTQADELAKKEEDLRQLKIDVGLLKPTEADTLARELLATEEELRAGTIDQDAFDEKVAGIWQRAGDKKVDGAVQNIILHKRDASIAESETHEMRVSNPKTAPKTPQAAMAQLASKANTLLAILLDSDAPGDKAKRNLRLRMAERARAYEQAIDVMKALRPLYAKMATKIEDVLALADAIEGVPGAGPIPAIHQPFVDLYRAIFDADKAEIHALGLDLIWKDHFLARWKLDRESAEGNLLNRINSRVGVPSRRTLEGPKTFLHQQVFPSMRERYEWEKSQGIAPSILNLWDMALAKHAEMRQFIFGRKVQEDFKSRPVDQDGFQFVSALSKRPRGLEQVPDISGAVYAPPKVTIRMAYDKLLDEAMDNFIAQTKTTYILKPSARKAWGTVTTAKNRQPGDHKATMQINFGAPEVVKMHEIGHLPIVDDALHDALKDVPEAKKELAELAALRYEGQQVTPDFVSYVHEPDEEYANAIHAYIWMPQRMRAVAPNVYAAVDKAITENPELEAIRGMQDIRSLVLGQKETEQRLPGPVLLGHYYARPEVVKVFKHMLEPGLRGRSYIVDSLSWLNNTMTRSLLSFSGFHALTMANEQLATHLGEVFRSGSSGDWVGAAKNLAKTVMTPYEVLYAKPMKGWRIQQEYLRDTAGGAAMSETTRRILLGGQRIRMEKEYSNHSMQKLQDALYRGDIKGYAGALFHAVPAAMEAASWLIMDKYVPLVKSAVYDELVESRLRALGEVHPETLARICTEISDHVDNAYGEMVKDNLFWKKGIRDVLQMGMISPTWNIGSARGFGGAVWDVVTGGADKARPGRGSRPTHLVVIGRNAKGKPIYGPKADPFVTTRIGWVFGVIMGAWLVAAIYQTLHGVGLPKDVKDVFHPRNGKMNPDGTPERRTMPGYGKDLYSIFHRFPKSAVITVGHKAGPLARNIVDAARNEDYSGTEIADQDAPVLEQLQQYAMHLLKSSIPISASNVFDDRAQDEDWESRVESVMGLSRASAEVNRTPAEQKMRDYLGPTHRTLEQAADAEIRRAVREELQKATPDSTGKLSEMLGKGQLSKRQIEETIRTAHISSAVSMFQRLTIDQAMNVYEMAAPEEREKFLPYMAKKLMHIADAPPDQIEKLAKRAETLMALPTGKAGIDKGASPIK